VADLVTHICINQDIAAVSQHHTSKAAAKRATPTSAAAPAL
jgi:hypothetical protein